MSLRKKTTPIFSVVVGKGIFNGTYGKVAAFVVAMVMLFELVHAVQMATVRRTRVSAKGDEQRIAS